MEASQQISHEPAKRLTHQLPPKQVSTSEGPPLAHNTWCGFPKDQGMDVHLGSMGGARQHVQPSYCAAAWSSSLVWPAVVNRVAWGLHQRGVISWRWSWGGQGLVHPGPHGAVGCTLVWPAGVKRCHSLLPNTSSRDMPVMPSHASFWNRTSQSGVEVSTNRIPSENASSDFWKPAT